MTGPEANLVESRRPMNVLHILPALGPGGPTRGLVTLIRMARHSHPHIRHCVVSLRAGEYMPLLFELKRLGVDVVRDAGVEKVIARIRGADVVLLHFWNTPDYWRLLTAGLPPSRYILWIKIMGAHAPQLLNQALLGASAAVITTAPEVAIGTGRNPNVRMIPGLVDSRRIEGLVRAPHDSFNADYIGTPNRGKIHPNFVAMMARIQVSGIKVRICGGALDSRMQQAIEASPDPARFDCRGFVEDIGSVLATSDLFACPLSERTYATCDLSFQEAMLAGVPPIVLADRGPSGFVAEGTGVVARSEDEFVAAVEYLHRNPDKRALMGRNAQQYARKVFSPEANIAALMAFVEQARGEPARTIFPFQEMPPSSPAGLLFLLSQNWETEVAAEAVRAWYDGRSDALMLYGESLDDEAYQVEGGILHWRKSMMDDPLIRSWTALWLKRSGRIAEAVHEQNEAVRLGAPARMLARYAA